MSYKYSGRLVTKTGVTKENIIFYTGDQSSNSIPWSGLVESDFNYRIEFIKNNKYIIPAGTEVVFTVDINTFKRYLARTNDLRLKNIDRILKMCGIARCEIKHRIKNIIHRVWPRYVKDIKRSKELMKLVELTRAARVAADNKAKEDSNKLTIRHIKPKKKFYIVEEDKVKEFIDSMS